jgi:hypothetical protein
MIEWSWRVERVRSIEVGSWSSDRRIDAGITRLIGAHITEVSVTGRLPELSLALSDGRWVQSCMTAEGQPSWVVFLPDGTSLSVERGLLMHDIRNQRSVRLGPLAVAWGFRPTNAPIVTYPTLCKKRRVSECLPRFVAPKGTCDRDASDAQGEPASLTRESTRWCTHAHRVHKAEAVHGLMLIFTPPAPNH